jgi:hypothetical protein
MNIWSVFGQLAISDRGETIQKVSENTFMSSNGTVYTTTVSFTNGSDGSVFTQMGDFSSDGSTRVGHVATGLGAVFNHRNGTEDL